MIRVLFLCLGNICRSPMAEAVFMDKVRKAGLTTRLEADSAGTGHWHLGEAPHRDTQRILKEQGIQYAGLARLITREDLDRFSYIIAMDRQNLRDAVSLGEGRARITTLMSYSPDLGCEDVPDPYYTGRFNDTFVLVNAACEELLAAIRTEHGF